MELHSELRLPPTAANPSPILVCAAPVVIIGANGSGKSRFGYWLEENQADPKLTHRISAQKLLTFAPSIIGTPINDAEIEWRWGHMLPPAALTPSNIRNVRRQHRHRANRSVDQLSIATTLADFDAVLAVLYGRRREVSERIHRDLRSKKQISDDDYPLQPDEVLLNIWNRIMPQRHLRFESDRIEASVDGSTWYNAMEMSDGERVALYLLAQCLLLPERSIIIIDEPELHLHKSIQARLWDEIERSRPSCLFVYITHDLDFASTRTGSQKIWLKAYDGKIWEWERISTDYGFPERAVLEVMGSRRRVLFCEGEQGTIDYQLYTALYQDSIQPRGSCDKVIEATKAMRADNRLHHVDARGIVDRDYRSDEEVEALAARGIGTLKVAEIENLLCAIPVVRAVASHLGRDPDSAEDTAKELVFDALRASLTDQSRNRTIAQLNLLLGRFSTREKDPAQVEIALQAHLAGLNYAKLYAEAAAGYQRILDNHDYDETLIRFNQKGIYCSVARRLGLAPETYRSLVIKILNAPGSTLRAELRPYLPF
jgi:hypothetical protein